MVESELVFVQLREYGTNVQMSVSLDLWALQSRLNRQCPLQEVQGSSHLANTAVVARHVVEGHGLAQFVVLTKFF